MKMPEPITIKRDKFRNSIATIINSAEMPALCMIDILEEALVAVKNLHAKQEQDERDRWVRSLKEKPKNPGDEKLENEDLGGES